MSSHEHTYTQDSLICKQCTTFKVIVVCHNIKFSTQLCGWKQQRKDTHDIVNCKQCTVAKSKMHAKHLAARQLSCITMKSLKFGWVQSSNGIRHSGGPADAVRVDSSDPEVVRMTLKQARHWVFTDLDWGVITLCPVLRANFTSVSRRRQVSVNKGPSGQSCPSNPNDEIIFLAMHWTLGKGELNYVWHIVGLLCNLSAVDDDDA